EWSSRFPLDGHQLAATPPLAALMRDVFASRQYQHEHTFITFNYDLLLDVALARQSRQIDYGLPGYDDDFVRTDRTVSLLKLHGSINWARCHVCGQIVPWRVSPTINQGFGPGA